MKQKLILSLLFGFLTTTCLSERVIAAEGDAWITPTDQNVETSQYFDIEVYADTGGKTLGAFNLYFDFTAADFTVDTTQGTDGLDKGADATNYNVMSNPDDIANGHFRFAGIAASGGANGSNAHLATIHCLSTASFISGTSSMTLRVNEFSNELGAALATGAITGATITYLPGDTTAPILSDGAPSGILAAGTTTETITITSREAATCRYSTSSGVAYASMTDTFATTGTTSHSENLTGLTNGTNYTYYVRCSDAGGNANNSDYSINFSVDSLPTNINLSNATINEGVAINTVVGALTTTDSDSGDTHTYSLACSSAGADDASFNISGANLRSSAIFDYETKSSYAICIRTTDAYSGTYDKDFTIAIADVDDTAPTLAEVTPVSTPSTDNTPDYVFSSDEAGTITYAGGCSSSTTTATSGNNTITFNTLSDATYNSCTIVVTDSSGNASGALAITSFVVDATVPTITSVSSDKANGAYTTGEVIDIDVIFSENVTSTGDVTVTLETGTTDQTCVFTVSDANTGTCNYTVQSGDTSSDLTVNDIAGTINDVSANAVVNFIPTTNLAANKALVIDTTDPVLTVNEGTDAGPTGDDTINLTVTDTNINASALNYGYSADSTCDGSDTYGNTFASGADFHITTTHNDYLCARAADTAGNTVYQLVGQLNVTDITAPVRSVGSPSGVLSAGTTTATLSLITDENSTCKYGTTSGVAYDSIANTFSTTGGVSHSENLTGLTNGTSYSYYIRCEDGLGNQSINDYAINFSVAEVDTEEEEDDDSVEVDPISKDTTSPYLKVADYVKEKLKGDKTFYSKKKEFSLKGKDLFLAGGKVKLYEGSDKEDEDEIGEDGKWSLKTDKKDNKTYTYTIKYYDRNGDKIDSTKFKIKVDSEDPKFTNLPNKLYKAKGSNVWWTAGDNIEIKKFKVTFDGRHYTIYTSDNKKGEEIMSSFSIPEDAFVGVHNMTVKAYDRAGNKTTTNVDVFVR